MTTRNKRSDIEAVAKELGIYVYTYSPGDGRTRYRFAFRDAGGYCGVSGSNLIGTVIGSQAAAVLLNGFAAGLEHRRGGA